MGKPYPAAIFLGPGIITIPSPAIPDGRSADPFASGYARVARLAFEANPR